MEFYLKLQAVFKKNFETVVGVKEYRVQKIGEKAEERKKKTRQRKSDYTVHHLNSMPAGKSTSTRVFAAGALSGIIDEARAMINCQEFLYPPDRDLT